MATNVRRPSVLAHVVVAPHISNVAVMVYGPRNATDISYSSKNEAVFVPLLRQYGLWETQQWGSASRRDFRLRPNCPTGSSWNRN